MGFLRESNKKLQAKYNVKSEGTASDTLFTPTGLEIIDYYLGTEVNTTDGESFLNLGIPQGKINMFIGHSQSGKTTLALQMAYELVKDLGGDITLYDFERSTSDIRTRFKAITGCTDEEYENVFTLLKNQTMTVDDIKEYIFDIADKKQKAGKACMVDWIDLSGNTVSIFPPTVIIIDSWAVVRNKDILNDAKMDNNMIPASIAKSNGNFLTGIEHLLEDYNISLFIINHITTKIKINPYAPRKIQLPGLQDDENLPGGNKAIFLASYIFRLSASTELKSDSDFNISGRIVDLQLLKTRSGYNIKKIPLVYTAKKGFSNVLTNFWHIKENKMLKACGNKGSAFVNLPNKPFSMGNFYKTYINNEDVRDAMEELKDKSYTQILNDKAGEFVELKLNTDEKELDDDFEG